MKLFDVETQIIEHLKGAKGQSATGSLGGLCAYRGAHGRQCAIGCLIPDELYTPLMEGSQMLELRVEGSPPLWGWPLNAPRYVKKLAQVLNSIGIPATSESRRALILWQHRHDDNNNWNHVGYIGPLDRVDHR